MNHRTYTLNDTIARATKWNAPTTPTIRPALLALTYSGGKSVMDGVEVAILVVMAPCACTVEEEDVEERRREWRSKNDERWRRRWRQRPRG